MEIIYTRDNYLNIINNYMGLINPSKLEITVFLENAGIKLRHESKLSSAGKQSAVIYNYHRFTIVCEITSFPFENDENKIYTDVITKQRINFLLDNEDELENGFFKDEPIAFEYAVCLAHKILSEIDKSNE